MKNGQVCLLTPSELEVTALWSWGFCPIWGSFSNFCYTPSEFCYTPMILKGFFLPLTSILIRWRWNFQKSKFSWDGHFLKVWSESENSKSGFDHFFVCSKKCVYENMKEGKEAENDYELPVEVGKFIRKMKKTDFFIFLYFVLGTSGDLLVMFPMCNWCSRTLYILSK